MPLDLETPVVITQSLERMRYKTDASITQTNLNLQAEFRYNSSWAASNRHVSHFRNEGPRKPNSPCLMSDRPTDTELSNSPRQPESPNSGSWTTQLSLISLFLHPRETKPASLCAWKKAWGVEAHIFRVGVLFVSLHKQICIRVKIKKQWQWKKAKKVNILTCSTQLSPTSHRVPSDTGPCQPTSYSHLNQECFSWVFVFH